MLIKEKYRAEYIVSLRRNSCCVLRCRCRRRIRLLKRGAFWFNVAVPGICSSIFYTHASLQAVNEICMPEG
jgi:hypothetical protein